MSNTTKYTAAQVEARGDDKWTTRKARPVISPAELARQEAIQRTRQEAFEIEIQAFITRENERQATEDEAVRARQATMMAGINAMAQATTEYNRQRWGY